MSLKTFIIDPDAKLKFGFDWSDWLATGKTLATSAWTITPKVGEAPTLDDEDNNTTQTVVWVSGCAAGTRYTLTNSVTDSDGQADDRSIMLICRER